MLSFRFIRLLIHLIEGVLTTVLVFPFVGQRKLNTLIRNWSRRLLKIVRVSVKISGAPPPDVSDAVFVANHISWLDMFLLHSVQAMRFISKADVRNWPLAGLMVANSGTLFIERGKRADAKRINGDIVATLEAGERVAFFPEGTTGDGKAVRMFHSSLLQAAIIAKAQVWPVAIRYVTEQGDIDTDPAFLDATFGQCLKRILTKSHIYAELTFLPPFAAENFNRRDLAQAARAAIVTTLGLDHTIPETFADLPTARR